MPLANVRGVNINYEVLGDTGPWMALSPGGRRGLEAVKSLAGRVAAAGNRVLIHDRRNCGASDVVIEGDESEYQIWADDLHELLSQLDALPAYLGGSSSGCRLSLLFALRYPEAVRGLLLWRITGGRFAAQRLAENYYGQFIAAAKRGGMAAVCEMEHFSERIKARPANRERLMGMDPQGRVALLQFVPIRLKALKPKETDFDPTSLGEHIKKKRLELGLTQKQAGQHLGVTLFTVINWEYGLRKPAIQSLPAICQFLGYDPEPLTPDTLAERLAAKRRQFGWTQRVAAQKLGVDPSTWSAWENGGTIMSKAHRHLVAKFLGLPETEVYADMRKRWNDSHQRATPDNRPPHDANSR